MNVGELEWQLYPPNPHEYRAAQAGEHAAYWELNSDCYALYERCLVGEHASVPATHRRWYRLDGILALQIAINTLDNNVTHEVTAHDHETCSV